MAQERLSLEQEEELRRLLTTANLSRMRGKWVDAEDAYRKALSIRPRDSKVRGMLIDVLVEMGKTDQAMIEAKAAMEQNPGNAAIETQYAKLVLRKSDEAYNLSRAQDILAHPELHSQAQQKPWLGVVLAIFVPGLAQLYVREFVKAGIIFGTFVLFLLSYTLLQPRYPHDMTTKAEFLRFTNPFVQVMGIAALLAYIYGIADAAFSANKPPKKSDDDWKNKIMMDLK